MQHETLTDDLRDQAALFALGLLDPNPARDFERHLREGCAACSAEIQIYSEMPVQLATLTAAAPPPEVRRRLLEETLPLPPGVTGIRVNEGKWVATPYPGIDCKMLYKHPVTKEVTQLVRFRPGARLPRHHHTADEQCLVLEGDVRMGSTVFRGGDFTVALASSDHDVLTSEGGCLLLIVASPHDEYAPTV